jgi:hypothetical protein
MLKFNPVASTVTRIEEDRNYAKLPRSQNKPYLQPKIDLAMRVPEVRVFVNKAGKTITAQMRQTVVRGQILAEEMLARFYWYYKAEVSFDMNVGPKGVPKPFLSTGDGKLDPNRRHSLNPFPPGFVAGKLRRPDLIVVDKRDIRWPGRATTDHEGVPHPDNLLRVVEMKFPGDHLEWAQAEAYLQIGGGRSRFTVLHIFEQEKRREPGNAPTTAPVLAPDGIPRGENRRMPIFALQPMPNAVFYEPWLDEARQTVHSLVGEAEKARLWVEHGATQLSHSVQASMRQHAPWLFQAGHWVEDQASQSWQFISHTGRTLYRWSAAQLRAAWASIQAATDLTLQQLRQIDWMQVLMDIGQGLVVVVMIAGVVVFFVMGGEIIAALAALVAMAGESLTALMALLAPLGGAGAAGALAR